MKRKIVKQGAATMMISLPAKWVHENKLEKGDEIDVNISRGNLIVSKDPLTKKTETEINLTNLTESAIRTLITNTYRIGYSKIKINFRDKNALKIIQETLDKNLIGFEIIKKTEKSCEIENITEPSSEQFNNIFSKIFLNIDELFSITENMLQGKKQEFEDTERKIQQFDNLCRRLISKTDIYSSSQLRWAFHSELIHGQREIYHLLRFLSKNRIKPEKNTLILLEECKKYFEILKKAYLEKNISLLEKMHELEKEIVYKKGYEIMKKSNPIVLHHILASVRNFYLASSPLIGLFIINES